MAAIGGVVGSPHRANGPLYVSLGQRPGKRRRTERRLGLAWLGLAWLGLAWLGLAWLGLAWFGLAWLTLLYTPDRDGAGLFLTSRLWPVIAAGWGMPSMSRSVGAMSARMPFLTV